MDRFRQWCEVLQLAPDTKTVNAAVRDYVFALGPLLDTLPKECRRVLEGGTDVQAAAVALLQAEVKFEGSEEARMLLHEVAHTFAAASVRIAFLYSKPVHASS